MSNTSNKLIFTNTLILYFRLFITLSISLYTSRVVLDVLGVEDFGLYNVIGGTVAIFSFFSASMQSATQRFLMFDLGKQDYLKYNKTFNANIFLYFFIAIVIFILSETIGLWYITNKAKIPADRLELFLFIYHVSIISYCLSIIRIPYSSGVVAQEKMKFFAYTAIFESILKLGFVILLIYTSFNKLIYYSLSILITTVLVNIIYIIFCSYDENKLYKFSSRIDIETMKPIIGFSGWRILGSSSQMIEQSGIILVINYFFNATANASYAIANQVNVAVNNLVFSFQQAYYPQITKRYADNKTSDLYTLILFSGKISFFLLSFVCIPILLNIEYILTLWLNKTPNYSIDFIRLIIICSLIDVFSAPLWMLILSTGKIKKYQIFLSIITLSMFLVSWLLVIKGFDPTVLLFIKIVGAIFILCYRYFLLKYYYKLHIKTYLTKSVLLPFLGFLLTYALIYSISNSYIGMTKLVLVLIIESIIYPTVFYFSLSTMHKVSVKKIIYNKLKLTNEK